MSERRSAILLLVALLLQLGLVSAQVPDPSAAEASALEGAFLRVTGPLSRMVSGSLERTTDLRTRVRTMASLREENERLRGEVEELRQERARLQSLETQFDLLQDAVTYEPEVPGSFAVADVVLVDHHSFRRNLVAYLPEGLGREYGTGSPVVTDDGLVGRVYSRAGDYVRVQLITDRASSVGVMVSRTRRQGIARGLDGSALSLDYIPLQASLEAGDRVLTAGIDGIYPRGLTVGTVLEVDAGGQLFHRVRVVPSVDLGLLSQVFVLPRTERPAAEAPDASP